MTSERWAIQPGKNYIVGDIGPDDFDRVRVLGDGEVAVPAIMVQNAANFLRSVDQGPMEYALGTQLRALLPVPPVAPTAEEWADKARGESKCS